MIAYTNGLIYTGHSVETNKAILVKDKKVVDIVSDEAIPEICIIKKLNGKKIAPAFIDLQLYGAYNTLFSDTLSQQALQNTYNYCLQGGASHFLITIATNSMDVFLKGINVVNTYWKNGGKGLLGLHLEGPYINAEKRGAHLQQYIKKPTEAEINRLLELANGCVKMITLAPECCDNAVVELLQKNGVVVSAGHSNATYEQAMNAFDKNISMATHLFNAMSSLHHRSPGMVGAILNHAMVKASIVCDGIHVNYAAVAIAKKLMQQRLFYITDAVAATTSGGYAHVFKGDHYSLPDGTLSGSVLTMMKCVENGVKHVGIELEESLLMASLCPAQVIGEGGRLGKIQKGYDACFIVFDDDYNIEEMVV
jgi:N-acetylglucosamine-6-phosphate deacetylase